MSIVWEGRFVVAPMTDLAHEPSLIGAVLGSEISSSVIATGCEGADEVARDHGYRLHHLYAPNGGPTYAVFEKV